MADSLYGCNMRRWCNPTTKESGGGIMTSTPYISLNQTWPLVDHNNHLFEFLAWHLYWFANSSLHLTYAADVRHCCNANDWLSSISTCQYVSSLYWLASPSALKLHTWLKTHTHSPPSQRVWESVILALFLPLSFKSIGNWSMGVVGVSRRKTKHTAPLGLLPPMVPALPLLKPSAAPSPSICFHGD